MRKTLFIIGNGFDLAHNLPTKFNPDFKNIAEVHEPNSLFWELYQSKEIDIWSDFENLLANPDFNTLQEIFYDFYPDYGSDRESDRDAIILQADCSGNLQDALIEFAVRAEEKLKLHRPISRFTEKFGTNDMFITFNYTHTLEKLYKVDKDAVLHIHGSVGNSELLLGYPPDKLFLPEPYCVDVRMKGRQTRDEDIRDYVESITDYYIQSAFEGLLNKVEGFNKVDKSSELRNFLDGMSSNSIEIIGHSYKIDFSYFKLINECLPNRVWILNYYNEADKKQASQLMKIIGVKNYHLIESK